jgi:hypothetical protein
MKEDHLLRAARNTLLDMLLESRGTTYPLADLPTSTPTDMVYFNNPGTVTVSYHQSDVSYQVFEGDEPYSDVSQSDTGRDISLVTKTMTGESHAFKVVATKRWFGPPAVPPKGTVLLSKVLYKVVNIKVGVNMGLEIVAAKTQLAFNEKNSLTIKGPQDGAIYYISTGKDNVPLSREVLCDGGDHLTIETTEGLKEDIVLSVSVRDPNTKSSGVLDAKIPIKVEPDFSLPASWLVNNADGPAGVKPALDYNGRAIIRLLNSQKSVVYRLFLIQMDGAPAPEPETWMGRELRGTDGDLDLPVTGQLTEDVIIGIAVRKAWSLPDTPPLKAIVIIPVKPEPVAKLSVLENENPKDKNTYIQLTGAQRGIVYQLYQQETDKPVGDAVFYHRNLGIESTRIGGDWIADHYRVEDGMSNWVKSEFVIGSIDTEDSRTIILPAGKIKVTTTFYVTAKKSTTGFIEQLPPVTVTIA